MEKDKRELDDGLDEAVGSGVIGPASVIAVGIFVICMVFIFGKVLFSSNSSEVPADIDTATINTDITEPVPVISDETGKTAETDAGGAVTQLPQDSAAVPGESSISSSAESSEPVEAIATMYTTQYAYLHIEPSKDSENVICMSPGIEVSVLGYEDNGYVHISFMNVDGPLSGYVYQDYLSEYQSVLPPWQQ
ncbi:MAG: SH3 domain-containing protein [Ruminococcus sp.]|nr:SH3 domain-containing protein [Ruminococcus sp.]